MIAKITEFQNIVDSMSSIEFEEMVCVVYGEKYKRYRNFHISHLGKEYGKLKPIKHPVDVEITYIDERDSLYHVFIAASNQQTNLYSEGGKLKKDCDSILNYIKDNNVSNAEIVAVYSKNPTERNNLFIELLKARLKNQGVSLSLVNAETLNIYINEYCPYVYRDYLHLNLYSGGISTLDNHLDNKLGEYYKYELLSRESELKELKEILSTKRCLLIRGHSGCGKTRLAIELSKTTFESNFKCLWIESLNISSINDFDNFYEKDSKIVVIIDDLNKIPFLNNVLQKILSYENTYVIMTLRDYLYDEYRQIVDVKYYEYSLKELEPNKIKEILKCIFNVSDKFLDFVLLITRNNLRFAIMATKVIAVDKKTPNSVDEIFDAYYKELVKKIEINDNEQLKRTIVALSFFDSIDLRSKENNRLICSSFGIEETEFLEMCNMAHEKEIADFYFDKMFIKISDQIFAEYLFYKYVFVFNKIDIFDLFNTYYKNRKHRFVQIIKAIVNVYYSDDSFNRQLNDFKNKVINSNDQDLIIAFFSIFAQLFPQDSIEYSFNELNSCEKAIGEDYLSISNTYNNLDLFDVLLSNYNSKHYSQVANCILLLVQKDNLCSYLIKKIVSNCSIKSESYENILCFYNLLIKGACKLASNDSKYLEFLFELVKKIYPYETDYNEFHDEKSLTFYQFTLPFNDLYKETRDNMWDAIYLLHKCLYDDKKLNELVKYNFSNADVTKHRKYDSEQALRVFDKLDLSEPRNIVFAFSLLNQFSKFEKVKTAIETMPKDSEANLYYDYVVTKLSSLYDDELYHSLFEKYFKNYKSSIAFIGLISRFYQKYSLYSPWKINEIVAHAFDYIFSIDPNGYDNDLKNFLLSNKDYSGNPIFLVHNLNDKKAFLEWAKESYSLKYKINFIYSTLASLTLDEIYDSLYTYALDFFTKEYANAITYWSSENIVSIMNFEKYKKGFVYELLRAIDINKSSVQFVESLFFVKESPETVLSLINEDIVLLKKIYFYLLTNSRFYDHNGTYTIFLLSRDNSCLKNIIELIVKGKADIDKFNVLYYSQNFIETFIEIIIETRFAHINFAISHCVEKMPEDIFISLVDTFIKKYKTNKNYMQEFSIIIEHRTIDSQIEFIDLLIKNNVKVEVLKNMHLFGGPTSWSGSRIPYLQNNIDTINDYLNTSSLPYEYRAELEQIVERLKKTIRYEEIEEFNRGY